MAGHYGQQLVTYGQANSTYGSWSVSDDVPPDAPPRHRGQHPRRVIQPEPKVLFRNGHLWYTVTVHGVGELEDDRTLNLVPVAELETLLSDGRIGVETRHTADLAAGWHLDTRVAVAPLEVRHRRTVTAAVDTRVRLERVTDPPDLWVLLDLPELA